ncbi:hypothetical protein [Streptomyces hilarionis]|uniref:hypothetical protein n=1 Tax=Streptomyces hilarionis TaxID=2839954 RepID=UPI00211A24EE|nr:hypothetical protein [Streptomyces hilarionis]MCQ9130137.1 hypothetical protein [Streptomyces hilarionis]
MPGSRTALRTRSRTRPRARTAPGHGSGRARASALPALVPALVLALTAVTGGCARSGDDGGPAPASSPGWEGKEEPEKAMRRAGRALDAVEPEGADRLDSGTADVGRGLDRTFAGTDGAARSLALACQASAPHTLTVTLRRGSWRDVREMRCGDREGVLFDVPAGAAFTVRIAPARLDGLVLWRLHAVAPGEADACADDVTECPS